MRAEELHLNTCFVRTLFLTTVVGLSTTASAGTMNSLLDLSSDGRLMACANRDSGSVTILEQTNGQWSRKSETHVGRHPEGVSFVGKSHAVAVAVYGDDAVVLLNADDGKETGRVEVFDEPYSVVSTPEGDRLYVTLDYPGKIVEIDPAAKKVLREIEAGPFARGLALTGDGRLLVTEYYTGVMHAIDRITGQRLESWAGTKEDNLARQIALHPSRPKAYLTHIRSRTTVPQGAGAIFPYVAVVDTDAPKPVEEGGTPPSRRKRK